jgi:predicted NBD/HSP70 family sugar kinase
MESILAAARSGDGLAAAALARIGTYVGIGVANLISIFGPEMVIVAGDSMIARDFIVPALQESVTRSLAFRALKGSRILTLPFDDNMWVRGAAMIVMKSRFSFQY